MAGLVLALAGAAGMAVGATGAAAALTGLRLGTELALLRGAFTGILELGAALEAALAAGLVVALTAGLSVCAGVVEVVLGTAGVDASFMKISLEKLTVYTVYTVDFSGAR